MPTSRGRIEAWIDSNGKTWGNNHLRLLRAGTEGTYSKIALYDWTSDYPDYISLWGTYIITNADTGTLVSWVDGETTGGSNQVSTQMHMAVTTGTSVSMVTAPQIPGQDYSAVAPALQAQDGSFVGTVNVEGANNTPQNNMVSFDQSGNLRWSVPGNWQPQIATADGGLIATELDANNNPIATVTFDQNGNATGQVGSLPIQSWTGYFYQNGSVDQIVGVPFLLAASFWALQGGQYTQGTAGIPVDSIANKRVKNEILTPPRWQSFKQSNCSAVFANPQGIQASIVGFQPPYDPTTLKVQKRQSQMNFYDVGNPAPPPAGKIGNLTLRAVTGGIRADNVTIANYLINAQAAAAMPLLGSPGPIILVSGLLGTAGQEFTLVHEVLLHAYHGLTDSQVFGNAFFKARGLWFNGSGSTTISSWMSTDCTCTPEDPSTNGTCKANTATW